VDLKQFVDLLKRESCCLNVEVIDDGHPDKVQYCKDNVELPTDIGNSCVNRSVGILKHRPIRGVNDCKRFYLKDAERTNRRDKNDNIDESHCVIIATDAPRFR
jgi:hypothetical protein